MFFSKNLKTLRKRRKLSQDKLARELGLKRSSIASYESKNVEPRIAVLQDIANFFSITLTDLIERDFSKDSPTGSTNTRHLSDTELQKIYDNSRKSQKMLEGFSLFFDMKIRRLEEEAPDVTKNIASDLKNFMMLLDHMVRSNQENLRMVNRLRSSAAPHIAPELLQFTTHTNGNGNGHTSGYSTSHPEPHTGF